MESLGYAHAHELIALRCRLEVAAPLPWDLRSVAVEVSQAWLLRTDVTRYDMVFFPKVMVDSIACIATHTL